MSYFDIRIINPSLGLLGLTLLPGAQSSVQSLPMPTSTNPDRFPPEFLLAFQTVATTRLPMSIPSGSPNSLKARLWGFQKALSTSNPDLANVIKISVKPGLVELSHRSESPEAREVAAALAEHVGENPATSLLDRLP